MQSHLYFCFLQGASNCALAGTCRGCPAPCLRILSRTLVLCRMWIRARMDFLLALAGCLQSDVDGASEGDGDDGSLQTSKM